MITKHTFKLIICSSLYHTNMFIVANSVQNSNTKLHFLKPCCHLSMLSSLYHTNMFIVLLMVVYPVSTKKQVDSSTIVPHLYYFLLPLLSPNYYHTFLTKLFWMNYLINQLWTDNNQLL